MASDLIVLVIKYPYLGEFISWLLILCFVLEVRLLILRLVYLVDYLRGGDRMGKEKAKEQVKAVKENIAKDNKANEAKVEKVKEEAKKPAFKAGNRVRVVESNSKGLKPYSGREGTVVSVDGSDFPVKVKFDKAVGKAKKVYGFKPNEIQAIIGRPKSS